MADTILKLEGVTVRFDGFTVLDRLHFSMEYGELRFLIGPNGAGKTTMLDIITGKTKPSAGRVIFNGSIDVRHQLEHKLVHLGIGRKFQTPSVFASLSVFENLELASGLRNKTFELFQSEGKREEKERILQVLELLGLIEKAGQKAGSLSHGEKQWLEIGILFIQDHRLLLLDEPVAGMTRKEREKTGQLLQTIGQNRSILVVEHDMEFVRQFARKVTVLHMGKVLSEGTMEMVQNDPTVVEVYLGRGREKVA